MCIKAAGESLCSLAHVHDHFKTQEMCKKAFEGYPCQLYHVPNRSKTQEMSNKAVEAGRWLLDGVLDWFVTQGQLKIWYDEDNCCNDNKLIK